MKKINLISRSILSGALIVSVLGVSSYSYAEEKPLVIVTSFPSDLTSVYKFAFEKKYPEVTVEILNKSTSSGVKYLQETSGNNRSDLFWASAPDAFEILKNASLLRKYKSKIEGIPDKVGSFPINDPEGFYSGFAAAGYGIMWNERYLKAKKIPAPQEWSDLEKPVYFNHVGMSAPSRSGTTHLTVETILQGEGWADGWATMKRMSGNFKSVTERSFGVPDGVNSGNFGVGIVIDFFGFSSMGAGFPVDFVYPSTTTLVPANIGVVKNAPNDAKAELFIDFLLSDEGQLLLFDSKIRRLPVNPTAYDQAPKNFPNPFTNEKLQSAFYFDLKESTDRYNLVNSLFDVLVTYRMKDLHNATEQIHKAEIKLSTVNNEEAEALLKQAKELVALMPITEAESRDPVLNGVFTQSRKKETDGVTGRQAQIEAEWDKFALENYRKAESLAEQAVDLL